MMSNTLRFVLLSCAVIQSAHSQLTVCRGTGSSNSNHDCSGGFWPTPADPRPSIPHRDLSILNIKDLILRLSGYHLLPAIKVSELVLERIPTTGCGAGKSCPFPFSAFVQHLKKDSVAILHLGSVNLNVLDQGIFEGFSGVRTLYLSGCNIESIHPDSFLGFGVRIENSGFQTVFEEFYVSQDPALTSFPWDSLRPFSNSLKELSLSNTVNLHAITLSTSANDMVLDKLERLDIYKTNLTELSQAVVNTISTAAELEVQNSKKISAIFRHNANGCSNGGLMPLVDWVRDEEHSNRELSATCLTGHPDQPGWSLGGGNDLWSLCDTEACHDDPNAPTTTEPPQTTPRATCPPPTTAEPCLTSLPLTVTCLKGIFEKPSIDIQDIETTRAEYIGDVSRKCGNAAYDLHEWVLEKAGRPEKHRFAANTGLLVTCTGRGEISMNEKNPDAVELGTVIVQTANTVKCREFFLQYLTILLGF